MSDPLGERSVCPGRFVGKLARLRNFLDQRSSWVSLIITIKKHYPQGPGRANMLQIRGGREVPSYYGASWER